MGNGTGKHGERIEILESVPPQMIPVDVGEIAFLIENNKKRGQNWMQIQIAVLFSDEVKGICKNPLD
jgi:hypothetical protein